MRDEEQNGIDRSELILSSRNHIARLEDWASLHWETLISKAKTCKTTVYFHECCFCFSRKGYTLKAQHPQEMTVSVQKIPELKSSLSYCDFFDWLFQKLHARHKRGYAVYFPAINAPHTDLPKFSTPDPVLDERSFLCKRTPQKDNNVGWLHPDRLPQRREQTSTFFFAELAQEVLAAQARAGGQERRSEVDETKRRV